EPRRELDGAQDAHRVLAEADVRVADGADEARLEVGEPPDVVLHLARFDIVEKAVDREVPAPGVLLRSAEHVVPANQDLVPGLQVHPLPGVAAEGRRLADLLPEENVGQAEPPPDDAAVAEQVLNLLP